MKRIGSQKTHDGKTISVRVDVIEYDDGSTSEREVVEHPGAVAILAHDDRHLFMVRQPREPVDEEALFELPAGKLDVPGEAPIDAAKRELVEEVGIEATQWRELKRIYTSPGFTNEEVHIFVATALTRVDAQPSEGERIEIVEVPLDDLDDVIRENRDSKTLVGLLWFRAYCR